jgi:hypothetical protein
MHRVGRRKQLRAVPTPWRTCRFCGGVDFFQGITSPAEETNQELKSRFFFRKDGGSSRHMSWSTIVREGERLEDGSGGFVKMSGLASW